MKSLAFTLSCLALLAPLACTNSAKAPAEPTSLAHTLFVAHDGLLISYDIESGQERPGTVTNVPSPTDMQVLEDGTLLVNLTGSDQILVVDGATMLERKRIPSSAIGGRRPVHSYLTPERDGVQYWVTFNDGQNGVPSSNSARFIQVSTGEGNLEPKGEVALGVGHHKAAFSKTQPRMVISNISDCDDVLSVFDYSDVGNIQKVKTWNAEALGWDGSSFARTCDPTFQAGVPPAPHGCATSTSTSNGKAYCNLTGSGDLVAIDLDATEPSATVIDTAGSGGGYTVASADGQFIYSVQEKPREGDGGAACQVGQLVTLDATNDTVVSHTPLFNEGPGCTTSLSNTDEAQGEPGHIVLAQDGKTMFVTLAGAFGVDSARVRKQLVLDLSNPEQPVQLPSIVTGAGTSHRGDVLGADGKYLFVADNVDGTVTQIDVATKSVARTLKVRLAPRTLATWGTAEGPSRHTGPLE